MPDNKEIVKEIQGLTSVAELLHVQLEEQTKKLSKIESLLNTLMILGFFIPAFLGILTVIF